MFIRIWIETIRKTGEDASVTGTAWFVDHTGFKHCKVRTGSWIIFEDVFLFQLRVILRHARTKWLDASPILPYLIGSLPVYEREFD